jgi:hypothetical protein
MGFHVKDGGEDLAEDVWKDPEKRRKNFEYCPELAMIMPMKLERERCDGDNREGEIIHEEAKEEEEEEANSKASEAEGTGAEGAGAGAEGAEVEGAEETEADAAKDMPSR